MGYSDGKIYKLQCDDGYYYYGSTIMKLNHRFYGHRDSSKKMTSAVYKHINDIGWDKVKILLVEDFPCENREQLRKRENEYIISSKNDKLCLNTLKSYITEEEREERCKNYYLNNKEHILERNLKYHQSHQEKIKAKRQETYNKRKDEIQSKIRKYREEHSEEIKKQRKEFYEKNKERLCKEKKEQRASMDQEELRRKRKEYRDKNKERINELKRIAAAKKRNENNIITSSPLVNSN